MSTNSQATPTIVVTGASGHLGRASVEALLERGTDPASIIATSRDTTRLAELAARGVQVRHADLDRPETLAAAFEGADRLLLVSLPVPGDRVRPHAAAIDAAVAAGVRLIAYTSASRAADTTMLLAAEHAETERLLADADVEVVVLRNGFYVENYTGQVATYAEHGLAHAAGDGRVSLALRRELGEAAAVVLTEDGHAGSTYELGGEATTLREVARLVGGLTGQSLDVVELDVEQLTAVLKGAGVPPAAARIFADVDRAIADGELLVPTDDLARLLGRAPTPLPAAFAEALGR